MITKIFGKKEQDYTRFWAQITTKNKDGEYVNASIRTRLSKDAQKVFKENAIKSKNKDVKWYTFDCSEFWLNAVEGQEENFVVLFVNEMTPFERED